MGSVSEEANQCSMNEKEARTREAIDTFTEVNLTSFNIRIPKISDCSGGHFQTCFMNEPFGENVKVGLTSGCERSELFNQTPKVDQYISNGSSDGHRLCINHDLLLHDISTISCLVDGVRTDTNKICDDVTSNIIKNSKEKYENDVNIERMSENRIHNNHTCENHLKSAVAGTYSGGGFNVNNFHIQKDHEITKDNEEICEKFIKQVEMTPDEIQRSRFETGDSHKSSLFSDNQLGNESNDRHIKITTDYQNNIQNSINHELKVNIKTMQQFSHDFDTRQSSDDDDAVSDNLPHLKITFSRPQIQDSVKNEINYHSNDSKLISGDAVNSDVPGINFINMSQNISKKCGSFLVKSEPQCSKTSVGESLRNTENVLRLSETEFCNVSKLTSVATENDTVLKFLRKNGVADSEHSSVHSSGESSDVPCKVITKYVFMNKASRQRFSKKYFGVLYKQAFRHFSGTKQEEKVKKKNIGTKKIEKKKKEPTKKKRTDRKKSVNDFIYEENYCQKQNRETRNKSREERRLAREIKKNIGKELNERMIDRTKQEKTQKKRRKKKENNAERIRDNKILIASLKEGKQRKRNTLKFKDDIEVEKNVEEHDESHNSLRKKNGISRTQVWKILKKKQKVLDEEDRKLLTEIKKKKKRKKVSSEKAEVEIKQEITDEDEEEEDTQNYIDGDMNIHFQQRKSKRRNRKDLTLQEKVQAIGALEMPGSKLVSVAKRFGVSVSAISRINKNREYIRLQSVSGDMNSRQRRSRECKDPVLDKILLNWFHAIEHLHSGDTPITISNVLIKEKAHDLAIILGKDYFPSDNWIIRWKNRHNVGSKFNSSAVVINDREAMKELDSKVNISEILEEMGKQEFKIDQVKRQSLLRRGEKPEESFICEHCGVLTGTKKKKVNNHLPGCPASSVRKDLTLEEKVQVVRALEQPGVKMVTLAKKYGVSASAISRIHKNRIDILARRASGLANCARRRDRGSKEPEVEKVLCEWFKVQHDLGIHISGSMIREKARDIAKVMGKDFWPSESWVFRWRHRNNVTDINTFLYGDSDEGELESLNKSLDNVEILMLPNLNKEILVDKCAEETIDSYVDSSQKRKEMTDDLPAAKQFRLPRSVMCEKCGFVSCRVKNNRMKSLRHAKGCPDLKPRNELTYENRGRMLKALEEPGATLSSVARQFGVSVSSMSRMNQKKDQILSHCEDHAAQKRIRDCKEPAVAYNLYQWYMERKAEGVHVTGPKLKEKARKFAAQFGREFNASSGWLGRWRHRYNIINSSQNPDKILRDPARKRKTRKNCDNKLNNPELLQVIPSELHQESLGSAGSIIVDTLDPGGQSIHQTAPVFIHQRFHNPWELTQQQTDSCVWTKELLSPSVPSGLDDAALSVAYTYGETVPKPIFHNVFDSFSAVGYQVAMPLDSNVVVSRDYLKQDISDDKFLSQLPPHSSHPSHNQLSHHLSTQHLHHHIPLTHPHPLTHTQQPQIQPHPHVIQSLPAPSPVALEDDSEQQLQVMEAFKIMSSFAQKKSLGDQVQAALRTIEMSMKSSSRKASSSSARNSYTTI